MPPEVRLATPDDRARVVETLVAAFVADPVLRYLFPGEADFAAGAPVFFGGLFDKRCAAGTAWVVDGGSAAALWDSPSAPETPTDLSALDPASLARIDEYDAAVHAALPSAPIWYLGVLGTHPDAVGRGWGRAVMEPGLLRASEAGLPAVLETSNPRNLDFYGRGGWEVATVVESPVMTWVLTRSAVPVNPVPPLARR
jgi:GNAT superfamily N-acetyltransferase